MPILVKVGGVDVGDYLAADPAISWEDQLNAVGSLACTFRSRWGQWRPQDGQEIVVYRVESELLRTSDNEAILTVDDDEIAPGPSRLFGGILLEPTITEELGTEGESEAGHQEALLVYECEAAGYTSICDRRLVNTVYESQYLGEIVRHLVTNYLTGERIDAWGVVAVGPLIEKAVFSEETVTECLNKLCELTGYVWKIDPYRVLRVQAWEALSSPIGLNGSTVLAGSVVVRPDRQNYRNHQIVRGGIEVTDPRAETMYGDGSMKAFTTAFPIAQAPTIEVSLNGGAFVAKTVGILGVEEGKDWYWNKGAAQVSQDDSGTALTDVDRVRVTYCGQFPVKTQYMDTTEIAARAAVEGGSGIYSKVETRSSLNSAQSAIDTAVALIARYGEIAQTVDVTTRLADFSPGMVATVDFPRLGLNAAEMLIETVSAQYEPEEDRVWYTLHAISGDPFGGWQSYFRKLTEAGKQMVAGQESEVLVLLRTVAETVECDATVAVATDLPESRIGIMCIGTGEIGA